MAMLAWQNETSELPQVQHWALWMWQHGIGCRKVKNQQELCLTLMSLDPFIQHVDLRQEVKYWMGCYLHTSEEEYLRFVFSILRNK